MEEQQEQAATVVEENISITETTSAMEEAKQQEPVRSDRTTIIKAVLANVLITVGLLAAYNTYIAQKIVSLDVKGFIKQQRDLFMSGKISEEQMRRNFDRLQAATEKVPKNRVIIMGNVLVRKNVEEIEP